MKDRTQAILEAVKRAKKSEFGVTAIKVELEANLDRSMELGDFHREMMERLSGLGLANQGDGGYDYLAHEEYETDWQPTRPLTYAEAYNDGSVDTEFTFTILLDKPENIFLLPKVIHIWNDICARASDEIDLEGAGMHMAFLNSVDGNYPTNSRSVEYARFENFAHSMPLLLPALFFLGASNQETRGTDYRRPSIGSGDHRSAIDWRNGALEFRLFDTCYDNPEQVLDNFVVMSKCLRYWKIKPVPHGMDKITDRTSFGNNRSNSLERFYVTYTHIDLLNRGLARLKPSYFTIKDIKRQRNFTKTKTRLAKERKDYTKQAEVEYKEYVERFDWNLKAVRARALSSQYEFAAMSASARDVPESEREAQADSEVESQRKQRRSLSRYIAERLNEYEASLVGSHTLRA